MSSQRYRRILDFIFNRQQVPEDIQRYFERWMLSHADDPQIDEALREIWDEHSARATDEENAAGLERLHAAIRPERFRLLRRRVLRYAGVAAAVLLVFAGGYYSAVRSVVPRSEIALLTAKGNVGEFTLPDGSRVWLNSESRLEYEADFAGGGREVTLSGEAYFEVMRDTLRPFRVRMNDLQVEVLGTTFDAIGYADDSSEEVVLRSGAVRVSVPQSGKTLVLKPDEKLSLDRYSKALSVERVDADNYCRWFEPRLIFDNTPLADIVTNLERRYNVDIALSARVPLDKRLSMVVCREPLEDILEVMSSLIAIDYRVDDNQIFITPR